MTVQEKLMTAGEAERQKAEEEPRKVHGGDPQPKISEVERKRTVQEGPSAEEAEGTQTESPTPTPEHWASLCSRNERDRIWWAGYEAARDE
eukprot:7441669-Heterocapsa_arctica.AAC.1